MLSKISQPISNDWMHMAPVLTIVVANLKGGSTKTTTAAFVSHALAEAGLSVLAVDADGENESLLSWSEAGEWSIPVIGMPVTDLDRKLPGVVGDRYDAVVIDTPPMKERRGVVAWPSASLPMCWSPWRRPEWNTPGYRRFASSSMMLAP